jgi:hypothetical protein
MWLHRCYPNLDFGIGALAHLFALKAALAMRAKADRVPFVDGPSALTATPLLTSA